MTYRPAIDIDELTLMRWKSAILGVNLKLVGCGKRDDAELGMHLTYADMPAAVRVRGVNRRLGSVGTFPLTDGESYLIE